MRTSLFRPTAADAPNGSAGHPSSAAVSSGDGQRPVAGRLSPPARRRRPALLALGVALAAAGGLLAATLSMQAGERAPVLAIARTVDAGSTLTAQDLTTARIGADPNLAPIPAGSLGSVVGKTAAVPLRPGSLLTRTELTAAPVPAPGRQLLGVRFKPGQLPARPLRPGQRVLLVATGSDASSASGGQRAADGGAPPEAQPVPARVVDVGGVAQDGSRTVDMSVQAAMGPAVAKQAATGHVALIVVPAGGAR